MNDQTILGAAASAYNDLQIPRVMSTVYLICLGVAFNLYIFFFVAESCRLQMKTMDLAIGARSERPQLIAFLKRAVVLFLSMGFLYSWAFMKIVSICDFTSCLISNDSQWMAFIGQISQSDAMTVSLWHGTIPTLVGAAALTALQYVQDIFITIRFVILALLYCIGPIAWACSLSELGYSVLKGWFKSTINVSFWIVTFGVIKAAILPLFVNAFSDGAVAGSVVSVLYAIVILSAIFMIPTLTEAVFSGANLGAVAGAAMSIATYSTVRAAASRADSAQQGMLGNDRHVSVGDAVNAAQKGWSSGNGVLTSLGGSAAAVARGVVGDAPVDVAKWAGSGIVNAGRWIKNQAPRVR